MIKKFTLLFIATLGFLQISLASSADEALTKASIAFYSEHLNLAYDPAMVLPKLDELSPENMIDFFQSMDQQPFEALLNNLLQQKHRLQLNDWLFFELLQVTLDNIYINQNKTEKTLLSWFLLSKSGYNTRITYSDEEAFVYAYTEEDIYETPIIEDENLRFVNLTALSSKTPQKTGAVRLLNFNTGASGKSFTFDLSTLPAFPSKIISKTVSFTCRNETYKIIVKTDANLKNLMKDYPAIDERKYLEVPLSSALKNSLLPQIRAIVKDKSTKEALEIIAAFTRSAFQYKEDKAQFGMSKPMIPEEVFLYDYSDCEDRAALFHCIVKYVLNLPMITIAYPDHLSIAVATETPLSRQAIPFNGKHYFICDPTGPANSTQIGLPPSGYERKPFEIIWATE